MSATPSHDIPLETPFNDSRPSCNEDTHSKGTPHVNPALPRSSASESSTWSPPSPSCPETPLHPAKPRPTRVHYTDELNLALIRICVKEGERHFLAPGAEAPFWQHITKCFQDTTGYLGADLRKKVDSIVSDRKARIEILKSRSRVPQSASTDMDEATDMWIMIEHRATGVHPEAAAYLAKLRALQEVLRDNLTKSWSNKRDYRAVLDGCELAGSGSSRNAWARTTFKRRRQIRRGLEEARKEASGSTVEARNGGSGSTGEARNEASDSTGEASIKGDIKRLTDMLVKYVESRPGASSSIAAPTPSAATTSPAVTTVSAASLSALNARMARVETLLQQIVNKHDAR